jgi:hypothetical protein
MENSDKELILFTEMASLWFPSNIQYSSPFGIIIYLFYTVKSLNYIQVRSNIYHVHAILLEIRVWFINLRQSINCRIRYGLLASILLLLLTLTAIGMTPGGSSKVHIWLTPGGSSTVHIYT